jgi:hypothetical protein
MNRTIACALPLALLAVALPLRAQVVLSVTCPDHLSMQGLSAESQEAISKNGFELKARDLPQSVATIPFFAAFLQKNEALDSLGLTCLYGRTPPFVEVQRKFTPQMTNLCGKVIPPLYAAGTLPGMPRNAVQSTGYYCAGPTTSAARCAIKCGLPRTPAGS